MRQQTPGGTCPRAVSHGVRQLPGRMKWFLKIRYPDWGRNDVRDYLPFVVRQVRCVAAARYSLFLVHPEAGTTAGPNGPSSCGSPSQFLPVEHEPSSKPVRIVGRYALYDAIAAGGMATVHYGRLLGPVGFSRTVAIKRLHAQYARDPEFAAMFLDEARLAARIRHPNVVPTLDVVATDGELFLVMEYVPGESFARLMRTASRLGTVVPPRIVIAVVCGLLRGLHAAHEATNERGEPLGIVHRDVSPPNILVGSDGQSRVLDFGVAKAAGRLQTTRDGVLKGKLAFMAPEQLRGKAVDRRTDIFAASAVFWEGLTGRRLFHGDNEGEVIARVMEGTVPPPSSVIPAEQTNAESLRVVRALDPIVLKGLATRPEDRYDTARAMAVAIEREVTPAGVSEVGDWVEQIAKDVLVTRAQAVADIESSSSIQMAAPRTPAELSGDMSSPGAAEPLPSQPARTADAFGPDAETRTAPPETSSISMASRAQHAAQTPGRHSNMAIVLGVLGVVGAVGVFVGLRILRTPARTAPTSMVISTLSVSPAAQPSAPPLPLAVASSPAVSDVPASAESASVPTSMPSSRPDLHSARSGARPPNTTVACFLAHPSRLCEGRAWRTSLMAADSSDSIATSTASACSSVAGTDASRSRSTRWGCSERVSARVSSRSPRACAGTRSFATRTTTG